MPGSVFPELVSCHGDNGHSLGLICSCLPLLLPSSRVVLSESCKVTHIEVLFHLVPPVRRKGQKEENVIPTPSAQLPMG